MPDCCVDSLKQLGVWQISHPREGIVRDLAVELCREDLPYGRGNTVTLCCDRVFPHAAAAPSGEHFNDSVAAGDFLRDGQNTGRTDRRLICGVIEQGSPVVFEACRPLCEHDESRYRQQGSNCCQKERAD